MDTRFFRRRAAGVLAALLVAFCFAGSSLVRGAEPSLCPRSEREGALALAQEARRNGDFHLAADCYRAADEPVLADRALAENFAQSSAAASQRLSQTIAAAREQARAIRESLRRR
jgi:hypothetical protein